METENCFEKNLKIPFSEEIFTEFFWFFKEVCTVLRKFLCLWTGQWKRETFPVRNLKSSSFLFCFLKWILIEFLVSPKAFCLHKFLAIATRILLFNMPILSLLQFQLNWIQFTNSCLKSSLAFLVNNMQKLHLFLSFEVDSLPITRKKRMQKWIIENGISHWHDDGF